MLHFAILDCKGNCFGSGGKKIGEGKTLPEG